MSFKMKPTKKQLDTFLTLCKPFVEKQRKLEANDSFVCRDDLSTIYRLLGRLGVWKWLK